MTCCIKYFFYYGFALAICALALLSVILKVTTSPYPIIKRRKEEKYFLDESSNKPCLFPNLDEPASLDLSIVVPAYNEEQRLPKMMADCLKYLSTRKNLNYEIIIVSDGSSDKTVSVAREYSQKHGSNNVRVLELLENRGKGGAVQLGVYSSRGKLILFADADGATAFEDFQKLEEMLQTIVNKKGNLKNEEALVVGSRAHLEEESIATRSYFRTVLMIGFHWIVWLLCVRGVRDTQCGFKLMTRSTARQIFSNLHVKRWAFDVELLYIAQFLQIPIKEVAVNWTEIEGSKLVPVLSWLQMLIDLFMIWLRYRIGAWRIKDVKTD